MNNTSTSGHRREVPILDPAAIAAAIPSNVTLAVDGAGGGVNEPDLILQALEARFLATGEPRDLTLYAPNGLGDGEGGGMERLAHAGMVRRVIGGHWGWSARMQQLALADVIEGYCFPQGVLSHLLRELAGGRPGVLTHIGLGTFADPRIRGGRLGNKQTEDLVELMEIHGREWLFYKTVPIDVALIRGTLVDTRGNLTMDGEGLFAETLSMAQGARNSGGKVYAQARQIVESGSLDPRRVKVPGVLVNGITQNPRQPVSCEFDEEPSLTAQIRVPLHAIAGMSLGVRKVIARRAAMELAPGDVVNLGFGVPDGVAAVLAEEDYADDVTFTLEQGHVGGVPALGKSFGLARNQEAMVDAGYQFDWYDGGGLDIAVLSFAEFDAAGNVNVGRFGGRAPGVGGFVNISQGARRVVFVGTFMAGGEVKFGSGGVDIVAEGRAQKLVENVEMICFSGEFARRWRQEVTFVTERAVFRLDDDGVTLIEIAPGVDLERDVLGRMGFVPRVSDELREMDRRLFLPGPMGLQLNHRSSSTSARPRAVA